MDLIQMFDHHDQLTSCFLPYMVPLNVHIAFNVHNKKQVIVYIRSLDIFAFPRGIGTMVQW